MFLFVNRETSDSSNLVTLVALVGVKPPPAGATLWVEM